MSQYEDDYRDARSGRFRWSTLPAQPASSGYLLPGNMLAALTAEALIDLHDTGRVSTQRYVAFSFQGRLSKNAKKIYSRTAPKIPIH